MVHDWLVFLASQLNGTQLQSRYWKENTVVLAFRIWCHPKQQFFFCNATLVAQLWIWSLQGGWECIFLICDAVLLLVLVWFRSKPTMQVTRKCVTQLEPVPQTAVKYRPWRRVVSCIFSLKASCVKWALWVGRLLVVCLYRTPWRVQTECLDHADLLQHVWRPKLLVSSLSLSVLLNSAGMLLLLARPSTGSIELFQVYEALLQKLFTCVLTTHTSLMVCTSPWSVYLALCDFNPSLYFLPGHL